MARIALGMSRIASQISRSVAPIVFGIAPIRSFSTSDSGSSGTRRIDQRMVPIESAAPIQKETRVKVGILPADVASRLNPNRNTRMVGLK